MKSILENYLSKYYDKSDLTEPFCEVNDDFEIICLGFKVGINNPNQIESAFQKSIDIFNSIFNENDKVWILINGWKDPISDYVTNLFGNPTLDSCKWESYNESDGWSREQIFLIRNKEDIDFKQLFRSILNTEQNIAPRIDNRIHFINPIIHKTFMLWDGGISLGKRKSN